MGLINLQKNIDISKHPLVVEYTKTLNRMRDELADTLAAYLAELPEVKHNPDSIDKLEVRRLVKGHPAIKEYMRRVEVVKNEVIAKMILEDSDNSEYIRSGTENYTLNGEWVLGDDLS